MIGDELIGKLWDTVTKGGIGSLAAPWQTRRQGRANADARRDELLVLAQTEIDVADIKAGRKKLNEKRELVDVHQPDSDSHLIEYKSGKIEPYFSIPEIENIAEARHNAQKLQEQVNVTKAVLFAEEELENFTTEASSEDIDQDWFTRWRDCAEKVSNEDLQRLWAKALAGELVSPGSYSLRTLEFIKNISKSEAHDIAKLAPYVIGRSIHQVPCLEEDGINFSFLLEMDDLGVISGVKGGGLQLTMNSQVSDKYENALFHNNKIMLLKHESATKSVNFDCYKVTKLGCEVLRLGVFPTREQYLEQIGKQAKQQGFEVIIGDWVQTTKDYGNYYNAKTL
ncbi:hypothetical protein CGJ21_23245 [Vibrio parahaemolyticus]|uniref:DUF2806 domain-containing protein n=1 Tax=Vibrio parahaemolyticus TaxID=670 RepID=UPI001122CEBD|nr:DUF2806 domain-containing protein [Vibrio parahaemolyticus]TOF34640.1 hypothetical protein CGJ23_23600 [Vibrio parahaemolyticus]TOF44693.1 hypothetical protein CGJ21_23245 [Vibrio parahaemolyticus]HDU8579756.1 DUF2806 domain-containing protein [Vibrio diabolicus]